MPRNYPEESIQRSEHGESLKSRTDMLPYITGQLYDGQFDTTGRYTVYLLIISFSD